MEPLFDRSAPKQPAKLSLNTDLLIKCRALNISLSATLERALHEKLASTAAHSCAEDNKKAIDAYNDFVDMHGCFGDEYRGFWMAQFNV